MNHIGRFIKLWIALAVRLIIVRNWFSLDWGRINTKKLPVFFKRVFKLIHQLLMSFLPIIQSHIAYKVNSKIMTDLLMMRVQGIIIIYCIGLIFLWLTKSRVCVRYLYELSKNTTHVWNDFFIFHFLFKFYLFLQWIYINFLNQKLIFSLYSNSLIISNICQFFIKVYKVVSNHINRYIFFIKESYSK